jgi:hypothetical protein
MIETFNFKLTGPQPRFCALEYIPGSGACGLQNAKNIVLLVIRDAEFELRFLRHPRLHQVVKATDLHYIESLLADFIERVRYDAAHLFEQLCALSVGPLVTRTVGEQTVHYPEIHDLALQFMPISCFGMSK